MTKSLGDRMKRYEKVFNQKLSIKTPVILFLDGRAFHTFTRGLNTPFDDVFINAMKETLAYLCDNIPNAKMGYTQSDEISILLTDWDNFETSQWFDYRIQKMVSNAASMATYKFNEAFQRKIFKEYVDSKRDGDIFRWLKKTGFFDCRAFNLPIHEVQNWFIWRQQDWRRNSTQMIARKYFSHKQLHKKNQIEMREMLKNEHNVLLVDYPEHQRHGTLYTPQSRGQGKFSSPLFKNNRHIFDYVMELERL